MNNMIFLNNVSYGSHERQKVDIFIPENPKNTSGLILYIHGGGWHSGDKGAHYPDCEYFSNIGYITATMNYRFVSEELSVWDELDDINDALNAIQCKCAEYNISLNKVLLSGASAGAHLALMYAYTQLDKAEIKPVAVCAYCPPVDCSKADFLHSISGEFESWKYEILTKCASCTITKETLINSKQNSALEKISPISYVNPKCVPTAVFHGKKDELIPIEHIAIFISELENAGVKNDFVLFENSGHAQKDDPEAHVIAKKIIEQYSDLYL